MKIFISLLLFISCLNLAYSDDFLSTQMDSRIEEIASTTEASSSGSWYSRLFNQPSLTLPDRISTTLSLTLNIRNDLEYAISSPRSFSLNGGVLSLFELILENETGDVFVSNQIIKGLPIDNSVQGVLSMPLVHGDSTLSNYLIIAYDVNPASNRLVVRYAPFASTYTESTFEALFDGAQPTTNGWYEFSLGDGLNARCLIGSGNAPLAKIHLFSTASTVVDTSFKSGNYTMRFATPFLNGGIPYIRKGDAADARDVRIEDLNKKTMSKFGWEFTLVPNITDNVDIYYIRSNFDGKYLGSFSYSPNSITWGTWLSTENKPQTAWGESQYLWKVRAVDEESRLYLVQSLFNSGYLTSKYCMDGDHFDFAPVGCYRNSRPKTTHTLADGEDPKSVVVIEPLAQS